MNPDESKLEELVRRIVGAVAPSRIVLFGSAGRGEMGLYSDLDILVVVPNGTHRGAAAEEIHCCLYGLGVSKVIVVVTEEDIAAHGDDPFLVIRQALDEGRELYHAA